MNEKEINNITEGKLLKSFLLFMLPLMASSCLMQSYVIADGLILGNVINQDALGSVNSVSAITDLFTLIQIGIAGGCSITVSHLYGAKKFSELNRLIVDMNKLIMACSVIIAAIAFIFSRKILELVNTPTTLIDGASTYMRIVILAVPSMSIYSLEAGILRGMGDSKKPMGGIFVSSCVNIGLDLLFVVVFKLGIAGAAIATAMAETMAALYLFIKLRDKRSKLEVTEDSGEPQVYESIRLGIPQIIQSLVTSGGKVLVQNVTNLLGAAVVIGVTVAYKVDALLIIPLLSLGIAVSVFAGQNQGANNTERTKQSLKLGICCALAFSAIMSLVLWLFGLPMFSFFGLEEDVAELGFRYIEVCLPFYWMFGLQFVFNGYLNGLKHTAVASTASIAGLFARVGFVYLGYLTIGSDCLPLGESLSWLVNVVICLGFLLYKRKKI